jgi:hypothetical protein
MKLEFLEKGSPDCPLIRLYAFDESEAGRLQEILCSICSGAVATVALHSEPGIEPIGGCRLTLRLGRQDLGIIRRGPTAFDCVFTVDMWLQVAGLAEPICERAKPGYYQWLTDQGYASLFLSPDGCW